MFSTEPAIGGNNSSGLVSDWLRDEPAAYLLVREPMQLIPERNALRVWGEHTLARARPAWGRPAGLLSAQLSLGSR